MEANIILLTAAGKTKVMNKAKNDSRALLPVLKDSSPGNLRLTPVWPLLITRFPVLPKLPDICCMTGVPQKIAEKRIVAHLLFCTILLVLLFTGSWILNTQGFAFGEVHVTIARFLFFIVCLYLGRWLCLRFYLRNELVLFLGSTLMAGIGTAVAWWLIVRYVLGKSYAGFTEVLLNATPFFIIGIGLGILVKLIRFTLHKQVQDARMQAEQKEMELNVLQSQLSPHFLFNTLNNIYSISIVQHQLLPGLLLKLSELLRYAIYGTRRPFLPLKEELAYINNYLEFEKIRIGDRLSLQLEIAPITDAAVQVPPMVLMVFIENAFKHARNTFHQKIHISISLTMEAGAILFAVQNSCGSAAHEANRLQEASGLGLRNTIKRLDLLYPDNYKYEQVSEDGFYRIHLRLPINHIRYDQLSGNR